MPVLPTIVMLVVLIPFLAWVVGLWALALRSLFPKTPPAATNRTPFITIIVPAHNEGEVIAQTVEKSSPAIIPESDSA
ncbi:MAG: hypothetical protein LIQ31_00320 [Planctomycetes bacterium]|nr:hypothetical protein [Planctomycetota bacterium]